MLLLGQWFYSSPDTCIVMTLIKLPKSRDLCSSPSFGDCKKHKQKHTKWSLFFPPASWQLNRSKLVPGIACHSFCLPCGSQIRCMLLISSVSCSTESRRPGRVLVRSPGFGIQLTWLWFSDKSLTRYESVLIVWNFLSPGFGIRPVGMEMFKPWIYCFKWEYCMVTPKVSGT